MNTAFDHLVIAAADLQQGAEYVEKELGVRIPAGGKHPRMGTHNCLMKLSDSVFLEVIAVDPEAERPAGPRWFGLDDPWIRKSIHDSPRLLTWVVNTDDITLTLANSEVSFGEPEPLSRGDLRWYFGVPDDGRLLAGGILPYIISWQTEDHPAGEMSDLGCSLEKFTICTPFLDWTSRQLEDIGALSLIQICYLPEIAVPYLKAEIATPSGIKILSSQCEECS